MNTFTITTKSKVVSQATYDDLDVTVEYYGLQILDRHGQQCPAWGFVVYYSSFDCAVTITGDPIGDTDDDGREVCDSAISAGGDCVGLTDQIRCISAAVRFFQENKLEEQSQYRLTNG
jgi:hypothetical protein